MDEMIKKELQERKARIGTPHEMPIDQFRVSIIENGLLNADFSQFPDKMQGGEDD